MLFSSITFLYRFLPPVLLVYAIVPKRLKNAVLLVSSLLFYFWGERHYTLLLILSSLSDYLHGLYIEAHRGERRAKYALTSSILINLAMLGVFKYLDFFLGTVNALLGTSIPLPGLRLPIGISFFTFQTMSYSIDVYRGEAKAEKNLLSFATYVCLFPQLVAGPIVRYTDIAPELSRRTISMDRFAQGIFRFSIGLGKKVLLANLLGELVAAYAETPEKSVLFAWVSALAWMLQVYYDFSGYSDMAIGLGHMLGFSFPENFQYPFCARSITDFWRRWHMTLSGWFRDYVYIPLGGNRVSTGKWLRNVLTVWFLTGLWHGAAWNFVVWGVSYGLLLILEKQYLQPLLKKAGFLSRGYLLFVSLILFTVFGANNLTDAISKLAVMFGIGAAGSDGNAVYYLQSYAMVLLAALIGATPCIAALARRMQNTRAAVVLQPLAAAALLILSTAYLIDGSFNPFLYFRF